MLVNRIFICANVALSLRPSRPPVYVQAVPHNSIPTLICASHRAKCNEHVQKKCAEEVTEMVPVVHACMMHRDISSNVAHPATKTEQMHLDVADGGVPVYLPRRLVHFISVLGLDVGYLHVPPPAPSHKEHVHHQYPMFDDWTQVN